MTATPRRRWGLAIGGLVVVGLLFAGRWAALELAERAWAATVAGGGAYLAARNVARVLNATVLTATVGWGTAQLFLVYRAIGSVQLPHQVGNLEIAEAVPRWVLRAITLGGGLLYGWLLSLGTGDWWQHALLAASPPHLGVIDPVLDHDAGYYIAAVPWTALVQNRVLIAAASGVVVVGLLYWGIGSLRFERGRPTASSYARAHLATLLAALAIALAWGAMLDRAEVIAGLHGAVDNAALTVRIPGTRFVALAAGLVAALTLVWGWRGAPALVPHAWIVLVATQIVVYALGPTLVRAARAQRPTTAEDVLAGERQRLERLAIGLPRTPETELPAFETTAEALAMMPVWDPIRVAQVAARDPAFGDRQSVARVALHDPRPGGPVAWLVAPAPREQRAAAGDLEPEWSAVHGGAAARAGAPLVALETDSGLMLTPALVADSASWFGPGFRQFAVVSGDTWPGLRAHSVPLDSWWRRAALAWALQSPELFGSDVAGAGLQLVWRRDVAQRFQRLLPMIDFDAPEPVVADGALWWIAVGYTTSRTFPLVPAVHPDAPAPRYERAGVLGVIRAATGDTHFYLAPGYDSLAATWTRILAPLILPADSLPGPLRSHVPFPDRLLRHAGDYLSRLAADSSEWEKRPRDPFSLAAPSAGRHSRGDYVRWHAQAFETIKPRGFAALLAGTMDNAGPRVLWWRPESPHERLPPFLAGWGFTNRGVLRIWRAGGALFSLQAQFAEDPRNEVAPAVVELYLSWSDRTGQGTTATEAHRALLLRGSPPTHDTSDAARLKAARDLLRRADSALETRDLESFGTLYEKLKALLDVRTRQLAPTRPLR